MKPRLMIAMACYTVLAVLAATTLDGVFRAAVGVLLAGLALKTWIASKMHE